MASPQASKHNNAEYPPRRLLHGRIFIIEYTPRYPKAIRYSPGGIEYTNDFLLGREKRNAKNEIIEGNKSTVYGIVEACGLLCNRSTTRVFPDAEQLDFPLPKGSLVKITNAVDHLSAPNEKSYNCYDIHEWLLPGEPRNPRVWGLGDNQKDLEE